MLSFKPSGGSVTTLRLRCKIPMGKDCVGMVVSQSLKSLCGLCMASKIFSKVLSHDASKWQFCSMTQCPRW